MNIVMSSEVLGDGIGEVGRSYIGLWWDVWKIWKVF